VSLVVGHIGDTMDLTLKVNAERGTSVIRLFKDRGSPTSYKEFTCIVSCQGREYQANIPASELQELLQSVITASIPPFGECGFGLDGISYELTIEEDFAHATYCWWLTPAEGWRPLVEIADRLLQIGFQVSGQYLP